MAGSSPGAGNGALRKRTVDNNFQIGKPKVKTIELIKRLKQDGHQIILWTCREGKALDEAVQWCKIHGLTFDTINENVQESKEWYKSNGLPYDNTRKVYADVYIDDKAVSAESFELMEGLI